MLWQQITQPQPSAFKCQAMSLKIPVCSAIVDTESSLDSSNFYLAKHTRDISLDVDLSLINTVFCS